MRPSAAFSPPSRPSSRSLWRSSRSLWRLSVLPVALPALRPAPPGAPSGAIRAPSFAPLHSLGRLEPSLMRLCALPVALFVLPVAPCGPSCGRGTPPCGDHFTSLRSLKANGVHEQVESPCFPARARRPGSCPIAPARSPVGLALRVPGAARSASGDPPGASSTPRSSSAGVPRRGLSRHHRRRLH